MADQKVALVTGAGRGIGRAAALALAGQVINISDPEVQALQENQA